MKQIVVHGKPELKSEAQEVDIPTPNEHQLVIKVVVAGSNPKDWKYPAWLEASNSGDDAAGYVHSVGSAVTEFKVGDRVAIFHEMNTPGGVFAEYAVAWEHTTFHLPKNVSFEEGATIPLAAMTSAIGLFLNLAVRPPLRPATEPTPLLVYGASSAVGAFAIKLAKIANIGPIIGVAGSSSDFAKSIGADAVVDYRNGNVVQDIKDALAKVAPGQKLLHVYDAISEGDSGKHIVQVADDGATITHVLRNAADYDTKEKKFNVVSTYVADAHHKDDKSRKDFAYAYFRLFGKWLGEGRLTAHPHEVVPGGLDGVIEGLKRLKDDKVNAKKLVFRVADGQ